MAYKGEKHGRDHCLHGADPIPCLPTPRVFRARQWNTETTTPTGVDMERLHFDFWSNPDEDVFSAVTDEFDLLYQIWLEVPGFIVATLQLTWADSFDFAVAGMIEDGEGVWPGSGAEWTRKMRAGHNAGMSYAHTLSRYYPTIDWEQGDSLVELPHFEGWAGQASGVSRAVQGRLDVAYWPAIA